jgi:hypothetical protein
MANLTSSGEISLGDIRTNRAGSTGTDISLKTESETFASGSIVDGSGAQTTARSNLIAAPYAISEFYDSNFSSDEFSSIVITTPAGTSDFNIVDGENLTVAFDTTQTGTHTVQLIDSDNNIDASGTGTPDGSDNVSVTFSSLALTDDTYTPRLRLGFLTQDGTNINYHDAIASVAVTDPDASSTPTVAANTTITAIEHTISSIGNSNAIDHYNWTFAKEDGDSGGLNAGEGSYANSVSLTATSDASPSINYKGPGRFSINLRVDGNPTQARNSATATEVEHEIHYSKAVSIGNPSDVNSGATINTAVTHQGFSSGVDVDLIRADNNNVLLQNDHGTNSTITKVTNQNQTFTAPDQANNTLSVKVRAFDGSDEAESNAFNIFPLLTTSKNVINLNSDGSPSTSRTIYSTDNNNNTGDYPTSFVIASPSNRTDNVTQGTYTEHADSSGVIGLSGDLTPSSQTATQPTVTATDQAGDATIRYTVDGNSSQQTATDGTVSVDYMPRIYSVGTPDIAGNNTNSNSLTIAYNWQGFAAASARYELFDDEDTSTQVGNDVNHTSPDAGGDQSQNASGDVAFTSLASTFNAPDADTYVIKVTLFSGASQNGSSISAFSPAFTSVVAISFALIGKSGTFVGYDSLLEGAEQASSATATKYRFGSISDGDTIYSNASTTTAFNGNSKAFNFNGEVFIINGSGVVSSLRSDTPSTPSINGTAVSTATDDIEIRITANALVTRTFRVNAQAASGGAALEGTVNADSQGASITQDISLKDDVGLTLSAGETYAIKVRAENNHQNGSFTGTTNFATDSARSISVDDGSSTTDQHLDSSTVHLSDKFTFTVQAAANDKLQVTLTAAGSNLTRVAVDMGHLPFTAGAGTVFASNGTAQTGVVVSSDVSTTSAVSLTETGLNAGSNTVQFQIRSQGDGGALPESIQTMNLTVSAKLLDSGDNTVVSSADFHTYTVKQNGL